jgi:hypothetical protein
VKARSRRKKTARGGKIGPRRQFGGRATAGGVNYEARIAAFVASHVLCGDHAVLWQGITGGDVATVTLQTSDAVDDVVVGLRPNGAARVFISAKSRSKSIGLTEKSAAFTETIQAFVTQFRGISPDQRAANRFVWAVPSTAGAAATNYLPRVLDTHRMEASDASFSRFINSRSHDQKNTMSALLNYTKKVWKQQTGTLPREDELREFLRLVYVEIYDFGVGQHHERTAESHLRTHVIHSLVQGRHAWQILEQFFGTADEHGTTATASSLRQLLTAAGIALNAPPDYASDINQLCKITRRNMERLARHTVLRFGSKRSDSIHLSRKDDLASLRLAVAEGDLLLTGDPGCGKSGIIYSLVERLEADGLPVVLLLAEEIFGPRQHQENRIPGLTHPLDEILASWPTGAHGYVITDALDAVRDPETQKAIRKLLEELRRGSGAWTVLASVREFDLKHSRELREAFPGDGFKSHASPEFAGVAHFFLTGLSDVDLAHLATRRPQIGPFLKRAQENPRSLSLHRSPFYLSLAADLLRYGVTPARLSDWNSPAVLFRKFWTIRVEEGAGNDEREATLNSICRQMVGARTMAISTTQMSFGKPGLEAIRELRSRGILQSPILRFGTSIQSDLIRFTHHLLHDYAIARTYIPSDAGTFSDFATREPLLPVFYRQSFMFALEELWDSDISRSVYWGVALQLQAVPTLHGLTRILAPILAARRVETISDLEPLLTAVSACSDADSPAQKALRHLASGMQDASTESVATALLAWAEFAQRLANSIPSAPCVEGPIVHIIARLNATNTVK